MNPTFRHVDSPVDDHLCNAIARLLKICFQQSVDDDFSIRINSKENLHIILAESDSELIGFKIGYEKYHGTFFSWLGGVHPDYRRSGIATELLNLQHQWCEKQRYTEIQTDTFGDAPGMLILNLLKGFEVYGTYLANDGKIRVQLRKYFKK
jgi:predicted GNAT superfamily acetyltransferase